MGGSNGGPFKTHSPEQVARDVHTEQRRSAGVEFETQVSTFLDRLLSALNSRNPSVIRKRLSDIKDILKDTLESSFDQIFGGSVAKHTYVDGLSDIDSLLIINDSKLEGLAVGKTLDLITGILSNGLRGSAKVGHGKMAVTAVYTDGMEIQLLPAIRTKEGLRVPSFSNREWANIDPQSFQSVLTKRNEECGGKLVPVVKLAKAINGTLGEREQLSGYHIESLAIAAFRGYSGPKTTVAMLPKFFESASKLVLQPMHDRTGQSIHVDDYLGDAGSSARIGMSRIMDRFARRIQSAHASRSIDRWKELFGDDE